MDKEARLENESFQMKDDIITEICELQKISLADLLVISLLKAVIRLVELKESKEEFIEDTVRMITQFWENEEARIKEEQKNVKTN